MKQNMDTLPVYNKQGQIIARTRIDLETKESLARHRWYLNPDGYAVCHVSTARGRKTIYMHRLVNHTPEDLLTDHINGDRLDNRRENLRTATYSQNNANSRPRRRRGRYRGVYWHNPTGKWVAQISVDGRLRHLGLFASELSAARAYDQAAQEFFGPYACPNFPSAS